MGHRFLDSETLSATLVGGDQPADVATRNFPTWHFPMLNDRRRNELLESSIREQNVAGKQVLEIGSGVGLTAMMLARHGAEVTTCEQIPQLFEVAKAIIADSRYHRAIKILPKSSADLVLGLDILSPPDVIFTETIDCGLTNEGFYSIAKDIRRLSRQHTTVLPQRIVQYGYLIECEDIYQLNNVGVVAGFDLSRLNEHSTKTYFPIQAGLYRPRVITPILTLRELNYLAPTYSASVFPLTAHVDGICHGLISYFDAHYGRYLISNDLRTHSHWHQAFHPLHRPRTLQAGKAYVATLEVDGSLSIRED